MITYVYIWKDTGQVPFYVGCTTFTRRFNPHAVETSGRTQVCKDMVDRIGVDNVVVELHTLPSIEEGVKLEMQLIALYGRVCKGTGTLINITAGGEHQTVDTRKKISTSLHEPIKRKNRLLNLANTIASPEYQEKLNSKRKQKPIKKTKEEVSLIRSVNMKSLNANIDFTEARLLAISSPETREKISLGVYASMEQRLVTMQTPEVQAKLRKPKSAEHNKKVSDAKKLWWVNKKAGL